MLETVLAFAAITAAFEAILLLRFSSERWLSKRWFKGVVHCTAIGVNLLIHWGTIVGTMTAITALFVSFITVPLVIAALTFTYHWRRPNGTPR